MEKPVIVTVDDEPMVLSAIARDLRRQYGKDYRIVSADSGMTAVNLLQQSKLRNLVVALLLVDQRMPNMGGVEFLALAREIYPDAKRVLLTAYADTDTAIRAINTATLDYYLMKPWDPPEEQLFPVLNDLLGDWQVSFRPSFDGIRVIGHPWSRDSHYVKDFLARNLVPYRWLDIESDKDAPRLLEAAQADLTQLPLLVFPDGSFLVRPTNMEIAQKIGLQTKAGQPIYDLIIVGGGPGGLAAAVYGASEGLRTLLLEREAPGGQAGMSSRIENYLGFPSGLSGSDLTRRAVTQARRFGAEVLTAQEAVGIALKDPYRVVKLQNGSELSCRAMLIATGVSYRKLNVPGMERLTGAGVYYGAAITEALSCIDSDVFVVGAGNSAGQAAVHLAKYARTVTILVRGASLAANMSHYLVEQINETDNIAVRVCTSVAEVHGNGALASITIANVETGDREIVSATALFIFIGARPHTGWVDGIIERDQHGFILTGRELYHGGERIRGWPLERDPFLLETQVPGIFVAGDVRSGSVKRVASAVGEGAMAIQFIHQHLASL